MWRECRSRQTLLFQTSAAHLVLFAVFAVLAMTDPVEVAGLNRWIKPMKFAISIAIYLATMAWYWPSAVASEAAKKRAARVLAATLIFEMTVIALQAARGVRSHFNQDTELDGAVFALMGIAILVNIAAAAVFLLWTMRPIGDAYFWGIRLGLALFIVFSLEGGLMAQRLAHAVGVPDGGPGLPVLNWSTKGGDLRVAHFVGMHALQGLPLIGWFTRSTPAVLLAAMLWAGLAVTVFVRAMAGKPLIAL